MDTSRNTITTMGIIANEVYDDDKVKKYFTSLFSSPDPFF